jgi:hypothetical protein
LLLKHLQFRLKLLQRLPRKPRLQCKPWDEGDGTVDVVDDDCD